MNVAWVDTSVGASGDMLLGALIDAGVAVDMLQSTIDQLDLGVEYRVEPVRRCGLGATKVHVDVPDPKQMRHLPEILELLSVLDAPIRDGASAVFQQLAEAEAAVHRIPVDQVHFHEVGALDCVADIVGVVAGVAHLGVSTLVCSSMGLGSGQARTEHGVIPVPVPAVAELVRGLPAAAGPADFEAMTPTGAALLVTLADSHGPMPAMRIDSVGTGAGGRDHPQVANVVRLFVGAPDERSDPVEPDRLVQLEANVDDLDPRLWPTVIDAVLDRGANDAWLTPIVMKKGRPALLVGVLCRPAYVDAVQAALFEHTSTIGVRSFDVRRHALARRTATVLVDGEAIGVKIAEHGGTIVNRSVEWDDVVAAAAALGRPPKVVLDQATALAAGLA
ncbi:MAG: nickel pincer cofactor biosynthesis protein LarC [Actinomycetota bacterium]